MASLSSSFSKIRLWALLLLISVSLGVAPSWAENTHPNIVILLADDLGYNDLRCYGSKDIDTPAIDQLATQGVKCTDFYVGSPICSPSRACLLTGRNTLRN